VAGCYLGWPHGSGAGAALADASELAAGWLAWWEALTGQLPLREPLDPSRLPSAMVFTGPPDFDGMANWPVLRRVLAGRWHEATDWYRRRKIARLAAVSVAFPLGIA
jgi:hypothetical protein